MIRKAITGIDYLFQWNAPAPIVNTPSITFKLDSDITSNLSHSRNDISVTAIATDRRTLTIADSVSLENDQVRAFLKTSGDTFYHVNIKRIVGTTCILSEALPNEINLTTAANLEFALWTVNASSSNVTSSSGTYAYNISYTVDNGQSNLSKLDKGALKVTPRPFNTKLSHNILVDQFAALANIVPRRQSDFEPQILAALDEMSLMIRDNLSAPDITEDEIFNPESFQLSHAYCTAARIYEMNGQYDAADAMRARCKELFDLAMSSLDLDLDGDGVIDNNEIDISKSGGSSRDFRASFTNRTISNYEKSFTIKRGMRH